MPVEILVALFSFAAMIVVWGFAPSHNIESEAPATSVAAREALA